MKLLIRIPIGYRNEHVCSSKMTDRQTGREHNCQNWPGTAGCREMAGWSAANVMQYNVVNVGSSKRQGSSPAESVLMDGGSDRRRSARVSQGVIPQAKIKTIKMTFVIVLGKYLATCYLPVTFDRRVRFYCATRYSAKRGLAIACRLSVRLSVWDVGRSGPHRLKNFESNCANN